MTKFNLFDCRLLNVGKTIRYSTHLGAAIQAQLVKFSKPIGFIKQLILLLFLCTNYAPLYAQCTAATNTVLSTLDANNGQRGEMFNIVAVNPITVHCFSPHLYTSVLGTYEIYYRNGGFLGHENTPADWIFIDSTTNLTGTANVGTLIPIDVNIPVPAGDTVAFYITCVGTSPSYGGVRYYGHSAAPAGPVDSLWLEDANMKLLVGYGKDYLFGTNYITRRYLGEVHYSLGVCPTVPTLYVDANITTSGNGESWATAYKTLDEALAVAHCCTVVDTIKVATGTYIPTKKPYNGCTEMTTADARDLSFHLPDGLVLWGGYPAGGGVRNIPANITTLSGDFNGDDVVTGSGSTLSITGNGENAYHVVLASADATTGVGVTIDGFTVTGGNANDNTISSITVNGNEVWREIGGGIFTFNGANSITNNILTGNSAQIGGAIYLKKGTNTLSNNTVINNRATTQGGGILTDEGAHTISDNTIAGNYGDTEGGIAITFSICTLNNNTIYNNAGSSGTIGIFQGTNILSNNVIYNNIGGTSGGILIDSGTNTLFNNTFYNNTSTFLGGAIHIGGGTNTLTNNIFWDNKTGTDATIPGADFYVLTNDNTFTNNLLQLAASNYTTVGSGTYDLGTAASGNIFAQDPLFINAADIDGADNIHRTADDGLRLVYGSPALNTGNNTGVAATDITGAARIQNTTVDMGAYEGGVCPTVPTLYVDASIAASGNGTTWATAYKTLDQALAVAHCCTNIDTIKVATGTYKPTKKPYNGCTEMTTADARDLTFHLPDGLVLWGGYPAGGGVRNSLTNITTLSGDFNGDDIVTGSGSTLSITGNGENAYHILIAYTTFGGLGVTIDGFSIIGGNANGSGNVSGIYRFYGGGIYTRDGTNTISNNTLSGNMASNGGGGIYTNGGTNTISNNMVSRNRASVEGGGGIYTFFGTNTLTNNTLSGNSVTFIADNGSGGGGGIYSENSTITISNNTLSGNSAIHSGGSGGGGGGISIQSGTNTISNNTLSGNSANTGGGIYISNGTNNTLTNNTISGNSATDGGGIYTFFSASAVTNNIFWGNSRGTDATIQGADYSATGTNGNTFINNLLQLAASNYPVSNTGNYAIGTAASGNIFAQDPLFANAADIDGADNIHRTADDGLALQAGSPCINTGNNTGVAATDITGAARIQNTTVDMGAYEGGVCPTTTTLYVDASIATSGNGQSWATAFKTLDEALAVAHCCTNIDTIKVATGTYKPTKKPYNGCTEMTTADARDLSFHLPDGLVLWGGYPTGGGVRNSLTNITTLSGDFNGDDVVAGSGYTLSITNNTENAYHVVLASGNTGVTVDGFSIIGGNANGGGSYITVNLNGIFRANGGGIHAYNGTNTLTNNTLSGNSAGTYGGGIYTRNGTNTLTNNTLSGNSATYGGGIVVYNGTNNTLTNNTLFGNKVSNSGGGIYVRNGTNTLTNNTLSGNWGSYGGGIYTDGGTNNYATLTNNTLSGNSAFYGGGIYTYDGTNTINNCIFWANTQGGNAAIAGADILNSTANPATNTVTYCLTQLNSTYSIGTGIINNQNPLFVNAADIDGADNIHRTADDGLQLSCGSPAYNAATATGAPATDITGTTRPQFGVVDMGAYESVNNLNVITNAVSTDAACNGGTGSVDVSATGGTSPYTGTGTFTETAGTYTYTVTDANGCSATASATVAEPTQLTPNAVSTDAACNGGAGSVDVSATGGTSPYTGTGTFTETAGTYTYTVTDDNGCSATASATVSQPTQLTASAIATDAACNGGAGSVDVSATGGTSPYTGTGTFTETAGTYTYTVTDDNGCSATASATVSQPTQLTASAIATDAACNGGAGSVVVSANGGTSPYTGTGTFNETAGTYTYTVTDDNGCSATASATVGQAGSLVVSAVSTDAACNGGAGSVDVSATGGTSPYTGTGTFTETAGTYTYTVTDDNGCSATASATVGQAGGLVVSAVATDAACNGGTGSVVVSATGGTSPYTGTGTFTETAGTYTYTVTDDNGCSATASATVSQPTQLTASAIATDAACNGGTGSVVVSASGGTSPYTGTGTFTETAGTYTYTVTDANGCSATASATVGQAGGLVVSAVATDAACNGGAGSVVVSATGGTSPYTGTGTFTETAGTYTYTVTDANGCSATASATVGQAGGLVVSAVATDATCLGNVGSVDVSATGGTSPYTGTGTFTETAGTYTYTVTDANGCSATASATVSQPTQLTASAIATDAACNGGAGSVVVSATGGTSPYTGTGTFTETAGTYTYTVTDANGCSATASATVSQPTQLTASAIATDAACNGGTGSVVVSANGGTSPYTGTGTFSETAGTYTYTVTDDNGCSATASATVGQAGSLVVSTVSTDAACNGGTGSVDVSATGGTSPYTGTGTFTETAGTYTYTVTDDNGCSATASTTVSQPTQLTASAIATDAACNGGAGSVVVSANGGTSPYTGTGTFNETAGTYTYTVTDANGCSATASATVSQPTQLTASAIATDAACNGGAGSVVVSATGGTSPYTGTGTFTETAGTYTYTVTDDNGCSATASATVGQPSILSASSMVSSVTCHSGSNGSINVTTTGGKTPYTYVWSNGATTEDLSGVSTGTYVVTVTDDNGCSTVTLSANVSQPAAFNTFASVTNAGCAQNDGAINLTVSGATPEYSYIWSNGNTIQDPSGLSAGTYAVTISDTNGCSTTTSASITALPLPSISMAATSCFAGSGIITVTASGTGLTYSIGGASQNSNVFNNVANGNYTVVVTNSSGCTASKNVTVSCLPCSIPVATNNSPVCVGANIGLNVNPNLSNGVTASYAWSGPAGSSTQKNPVIANATLAKAGVYTVTVTYSNGCVATASTTVIVNAKPTVTIAASGPLSFCAGGSVTLTAGGGNAYNWSNGSTTAFTTIASSGTYTVTVTNAAGCTATAKRTIVVNALPNVSANLSCGISSATITVNATGNAPFQYSIGGAFQGSNVFNNVANGTYVVTVTNVNGCSRTTSIVVNCVYCSATAAIVTATASCAGEPIVATASGYNTATGYAFYYLLADANGNIVAVNTTGTFATTSLTIGATYTVYGYNVKTSALVGGPNPPAVGTNVGSITGSCFALSNASATVVIPNLITIANSSSEGASNGTSPFTYNTTTIEITGGTTPYNFDWDIEGYVRYDIAYTQTGATITIYYSNDASWSVTTTDGNECTTGGAVFSNLPGNVNTLLDIDSYTVTPTNLGNDGSINLAASGGDLSCGTYQYQWTGPDTWTGSYATTGNGAYTLSGLPSGWYSVIITDCAGNIAEGWYWVPEGSRGRTKAVETLSVLPNPFADKAIVEFTVNVSGNTTVNVYSIDGKQVATLYNANTQAGETYQVTLDGANLPSGMYFVKMTNANGETMLQKAMINR
jgi:parallel beta-helix repeat protein